MARVFNRGELKAAVLAVIATLGEGHGYAIMQELQQRVGSQWRASPGAIYPALVALESEHSVKSEERNGLRIYRLTADGEAALAAGELAPPWRDIARRAAHNLTPQPTLGQLLERFQVGLPQRAVLAPRQARDIDALLTRARQEISAMLEQGDDDG
jgi:DNA-binding PadR family transcriptional regulator